MPATLANPPCLRPVPEENNPEVMNALSARLGLTAGKLAFHDVWSLTEPELLSHIPRPCLGLLVIIPLTPTWHASRTAEDATLPDPDTSTDPSTQTPVLWFPQTIGHACGSIGLLHLLLNLPPAVAASGPDSTLAVLRRAALALPKASDRAQLLYDSEGFEEAHASVAGLGDTAALTPDIQNGQHFVAFVKGADGHLWELEGARRGPLDRGALEEGEDVLSPAAVARGIGRVMEMERDGGGGDLRFSVIALSAVAGGGGGEGEPGAGAG